MQGKNLRDPADGGPAARGAVPRLPPGRQRPATAGLRRLPVHARDEHEGARRLRRAAGAPAGEVPLPLRLSGVLSRLRQGRRPPARGRGGVVAYNATRDGAMMRTIRRLMARYGGGCVIGRALLAAAMLTFGQSVQDANWSPRRRATRVRSGTVLVVGSIHGNERRGPSGRAPAAPPLRRPARRRAAVDGDDRQPRRRRRRHARQRALGRPEPQLRRRTGSRSRRRAATTRGRSRSREPETKAVRAVPASGSAPT